MRATRGRSPRWRTASRTMSSDTWRQKILIADIAACMNPRPLVVRFGALGDMVILTVAIRHLHERFGQPVDLLASGSWTWPLLHDQPGVGNIFLIGSRKRPYWLSPDQHRLVRRLRARGAGPTWLFDHDNRKTCGLLVHAGWT